MPEHRFEIEDGTPFNINGETYLIGPRVGPDDLGMIPDTAEYRDHVRELTLAWDHEARPDWQIATGNQEAA